MFTGIVEELGTITGLEQLADSARLTVHGPVVTSDAKHGDSIAVNGVCLTVVTVEAGAFTADVMQETLDRSALGGLDVGSQVNLERAVRLQDRLGGHLVQGHVDGVGEVVVGQPGRALDCAQDLVARVVSAGTSWRRARSPSTVSALLFPPYTRSGSRSA